MGENVSDRWCFDGLKARAREITLIASLSCCRMKGEAVCDGWCWEWLRASAQEEEDPSANFSEGWSLGDRGSKKESWDENQVFRRPWQQARVMGCESGLQETVAR